MRKEERRENVQEISILGQMAAFYGRLAWEEVPKEVIEKAKLCLLDVLECCQAAPLDRRMKGALGSVSKYKTDAGAIVWGRIFVFGQETRLLRMPCGVLCPTGTICTGIRLFTGEQWHVLRQSPQPKNTRRRHHKLYWG